MAQDSILGSSLNTIGLSARDKLAYEVAYAMGLNLAVFNMHDIFLETEMEINYAFSQAHHTAVDIKSLPSTFSFVKIGPIMGDIHLFYLLNGGDVVGMYLGRIEGNKIYFMGRGLTTLFSSDTNIIYD